MGVYPIHTGPGIKEAFENCEMNEYYVWPISPLQKAHVEQVITMFRKRNI